MKRLERCLLVLVFFSWSQVQATGIVRIADGDCAGLSAAAGAAPGQEPPLIVLARNGTYAACPIDISGTIAIDGAGARMKLLESQSNGGPESAPQINVRAAARLTLRNINFGGSLAAPASRVSAQPKFLITYFPAIENAGTLVLDAVSIANASFGHYGGLSQAGGGLIGNSGNVIVRNSTIANNTLADFSGLLHGNVDIEHSTFANNDVGRSGLLGPGTIALSNSIVEDKAGPVCAPSVNGEALQIVSRGGNVLGDASCALHAQGDRVVADARFSDFAAHGGVVDTYGLNYDSPALGNGSGANCLAADARGYARGTTTCDSGAYERGGGSGKLAASGMSGLFFNPSNDGHYVSVQRLSSDSALVIWNTFDENGTPAWLYGVGNVNGDAIHVDQVAQNVGGKLQPGGSVSGSKATLWGTLDVRLSDCYNAQLSYSSPLSQFGSGSTALQRLAFLDGVNCEL